MGLRGEEMEDPVELGRGRAAVGPLARRHMEGGGGKGGGTAGMKRGMEDSPMQNTRDGTGSLKCRQVAEEDCPGVFTHTQATGNHQTRLKNTFLILRRTADIPPSKLRP